MSLQQLGSYTCDSCGNQKTVNYGSFAMYDVQFYIGVSEYQLHICDKCYVVDGPDAPSIFKRLWGKVRQKKAALEGK